MKHFRIAFVDIVYGNLDTIPISRNWLWTTVYNELQAYLLGIEMGYQICHLNEKGTHTECRVGIDFPTEYSFQTILWILGTASTHHDWPFYCFPSGTCSRAMTLFSPNFVFRELVDTKCQAFFDNFHHTWISAAESARHTYFVER